MLCCLLIIEMASKYEDLYFDEHLYTPIPYFFPVQSCTCSANLMASNDLDLYTSFACFSSASKHAASSSPPGRGHPAHDGGGQGQAAQPRRAAPGNCTGGRHAARTARAACWRPQACRATRKVAGADSSELGAALALV